MSELKTDKTTVRRVPSRGSYTREELFAVLDAEFVCHVGFVYQDYPVVIPTAFGRDDDYVYIHGATSSRLIRALESGEAPLCITVTLVDGLVLARSVFHHSMNYRSAVVFGKAEKLEGDEKMRGLEIVTNHIINGRWEEARLPNDKEMKATTVLRVPIEEASVKVRTGPPGDDLEDYELPIWAGVIPLTHEAGQPIDDPDMKIKHKLPDSVLNYKKDG